MLIAHVGKERESGMRGAVTAFAHRLPLSAVKGTFESKKVKIQGLGTFYLTCECQKSGADREQDFNKTKERSPPRGRSLLDEPLSKYEIIGDSTYRINKKSGRIYKNKRFRPLKFGRFG